jgi:hypothetical protein
MRWRQSILAFALLTIPIRAIAAEFRLFAADPADAPATSFRLTDAAFHVPTFRQPWPRSEGSAIDWPAIERSIDQTLTVVGERFANPPWSVVEFQLALAPDRISRRPHAMMSAIAPRRTLRIGDSGRELLSVLGFSGTATGGAGGTEHHYDDGLRIHVDPHGKISSIHRNGQPVSVIVIAFQPDENGHR